MAVAAKTCVSGTHLDKCGPPCSRVRLPREGKFTLVFLSVFISGMSMRGTYQP